MKRIRLSAFCDRFLVTGLLIVLALLLGAMVYALRGAASAFYAALAASIFLLLLFGTYAYSVCAACCVLRSGSMTVGVRGLRSFSITLEEVKSVAAVPFRFGSVDTRRIVFYDGEGNAVAAVATSFLLRAAKHADSAAELLAKELCLVHGTTSAPTAEEATQTPDEIDYDALDDER